ncbi:ribonuclease H-like domain-containing protein [Tanacetum coccineum]
MSIDDLYNNFKIVEQSVKKSVGASSGAQNLAFMTAPSTSSTNDVNTAKPAYEVSTASPNVNTASPQVDLEQIHEDYLEAMDFVGILDLMRQNKYKNETKGLKLTGKKIFINANDTAGYDKSKVECFNCHKMRHFARECKAPRNTEGQFRNQDNTRKQGNNEDTSSKAMLAIDGVVLMNSKSLNSKLIVLKQVEKDTSSFVESSLNVDKETVFLINKKVEFVKPKYHKKPVKKSVRVNYNYTTKRTHPNAQRNMVPRAVLMKTGLKPFNTARTVNTAHPKSTVFSAKPMPRFSKIAQSTVRRPFQPKTVLTNKRFTQKVNTAKAQAVNTARPKAVKTARPNSAVVNAVRVNQANAGKPQQDDTRFVDSGCSRHMTGNIAYLSDFKEFDGGYVTFGGGAHGGRISGKGTLKTDSLDCEDLPNENQILLKIPRKDNMYSFDIKNIVSKESLTCLVAKATLDESMIWHKRLGHINFKNINKLVKDNRVRGLPTKHFENDQTCVACLKGKQHRASCIKREYSIARTPQQNDVAERRNRTLIEAARTMLADSKLPTTFWAEAVSTACYVHNRVLVVKPHNKTPYELFRGFKPALSFMKPFGCHVTILNTLDRLGTIINESTGTQRELNVGTSEEISQDCIMMPIWNNASYFDLLSKNINNGEPKSAEDQKQVEDGLDNKNGAKDKSDDDSSPKEVNAAGQHVNTASPDVNIGSFKLNVVGPSVNTASTYDQDSPKDMFIMVASHTLEATHVEFFSDKDEPEIDLGNITNSYTVLTTPNTRIHKDHTIENVIGDIEPISIAKALSDSSWVEAMQEELLQFKL